MFFSIITVTFNAEKTLNQTIDSILKQTCKDYELIVFDGKSFDNTVGILNSYSGSFKDYYYVSEPDNGIYDAMNKGIHKARGKYLYFLNAGDSFVDEYVLEKVKSYIEEQTEDDNSKYIFQGNVIRGGVKKEFPPKFIRWKWIFLEHAYFSHQGLFADRRTFDGNMFDTTLKVCADREWLICSIEAGAVYKPMNSIDVAYYADGGVSNGYRNQQADSLEISKRHGGIVAYLFVIMKRSVGALLGHER